MHMCLFATQRAPPLLNLHGPSNPATCHSHVQGVYNSFVVENKFKPDSKHNYYERLLQDVVSMSFESLPSEGRHMFLDCVSVLHGQDIGLAEELWRVRWPNDVDSAFLELQRCSLVSIDDKGKLVVHDVICTLGRAMLQDANSGFYGSRLWVDGDGRLVEFEEV